MNFNIPKFEKVKKYFIKNLDKFQLPDSIRNSPEKPFLLYSFLK